MRNKLESIYQNLGGGVEMPDFQERTLYMHKTSMDNLILPSDFMDFGTSIQAVLQKVKNLHDVCYITIDEKRIQNTTHRRSGLHVDFNWYENLQAHGGGGGGHGQPAKTPSRTGGHGDNGGGHGQPATTPSWQGRHGGPSEEELRKRQADKRKGKIERLLEDDEPEDAWFNTVKNGGMLLVSNHVGCQVYKGDIIGSIGEGGCCVNIQTDHLQSELMQPNDVFYLNALGIHESITIKETVERSLIRINFHPDYIFQSS